MSKPLIATHEPCSALFARAKAKVQEVLRGKDEVVELALVAAVAGGHVLVEDVPGVGKTTLARAMAGALGGSFRRIQFTSDLLPGDIMGVNVLGGDDVGGFHFRPGPLFANVVLADEINRGTPKAQSALLEAMSEGCVTTDGQTHPLPQPFTVIATQNPMDQHGTFPLPDSQLDRFLVRLAVGYPAREVERTILRNGRGRPPAVTSEGALTSAEVARLLAGVDAIAVPPAVEDYLLSFVARTREDARLVRGCSTRGAEALYRASQTRALARGREYVVPEDVQALAVPTLAHRVLDRTGDPSGEGTGRTIREILWSLPVPD